MKKYILSFLIYWVAIVATADVKVEQAYIPKLPPTANNVAAYFKVTNEGNKPRVLLGVESIAFAMAHYHHTKVKEGVASMESMHKLIIPAGESIIFEPGGMHVMLMKPKDALATKMEIPLVLLFEDGERLSVSAIVRAIN